MRWIGNKCGSGGKFEQKRRPLKAKNFRKMNQGLISNCKEVITFYREVTYLHLQVWSHSFDLMLVFENLFYILSSDH